MAEYWFSDYPVSVATKTGTPQFYGNYTKSTFISFAPADEPQIAVAVVVEKGGGVPCAPIVKTIYDAYFGFGSGNGTESGGNLLLQ
jgi:penicillin-binding protein 2